MHEEEGGGEVEVEGFLPAFAGHFEEGQIEETAGVAHEDVERGFGGEGGGEQCFRAFRGQEVARDVGGVGGEVGGLGRGQAVEDDARAGVAEAEGDGVADALGGAGDEGGVGVKREGVHRGV